MQLRTDSRGQASQISYVLMIAISAVLISGIVTASGTLVSGEKENAVETQLRVIGDKLAAQIEAADAIAAQDPDAQLYIETAAPETAVGSGYLVTVNGTAGPANDYLILQSQGDPVSVRIPMNVETSLSDTRVASGDIVIERTSGNIEVNEENP